jgi:hypothetical protein
MDERRLAKEIYEVDLDGIAVKGKPWRIYLDQIEQVLEKGQVKSTRNRSYMRILKVEKAKGLCKDLLRGTSLLRANGRT